MLNRCSWEGRRRGHETPHLLRCLTSTPVCPPVLRDLLPTQPQRTRSTTKDAGDDLFYLVILVLLVPDDDLLYVLILVLFRPKRKPRRNEYSVLGTRYWERNWELTTDN